VKDHNAIALNYRTFLTKPAIDPESEADLSATPYSLTNISVCWASSGTLIVSAFSATKPEIHSLTELSTTESQKHYLGTCVRIAPNGSLAKLVSFEDPVAAALEDANHRIHRKRVKVGQAEQGLEKWKSIVTRWLSFKGYTIPGLEKRTAWAKIWLSQTGRIVPPSPSPLNYAREVWWPRALCFYYDTTDTRNSDSQLGSTASQKIDGLEWFQTPQSTGFQDPVDVAQHWFLGKPERDKTLEARRKAQKAEEDAARPKEENHGGLFPSSPLNSRTGAYGDLQAVAGVYPTPPDGVLPGTGISSGDTPSISGTTTNTVLVPGGSNPAINLSAPQDNANGSGLQLPATSPDFPGQYDSFNPSGGNDDLFEDMDEDYDPGNGVTDADFNFFDDEDDDMPDVTESQDSKSVPVKKETENEPAASDLEMKDTSDPMAALESALESATESPLELTQRSKEEEQAKETPLVKTAVMEPLSSQLTLLNSSSMATIPKEPTPPLSPQHIQERLLPSPKHKTNIHTPQKQITGHHRDSIFDPVSFNRKMSLSDAKYQGGRFSFRPEGQNKTTGTTKTNPKRPASLRDLPLITKLRYAVGVASNNAPIPEIKALARADGDFSSDSMSDTSSIAGDELEDIASLPPEPLSAGLIGPGKRKLPTDGHATPLSTTSFADSLGGDSLDLASIQLDDSSLALFEPNAWDWPLTNVPPPTEVQPNTGRYTLPAFSPIIPSMPNTPTSQPDMSFDISDDKPLSRADSIAVAQVVTDQIISATLDILHEDSSASSMKLTRTSSDTRLSGIIRDIFPKAFDCTFQGLVSVPDIFPELPPQAKGQQRPPPRRPNELPALPGYHIIPFSPPHVRVRRAETSWDLLPPALSFWESLGLSPCSPAKNISAFCIYPHSDALRPCLEHFLFNMQIAYEGSKLGNHERVETIPEYEGGLVPCKIGSAVSTRAAFKSLRETCSNFGKLLASRHSQIRDSDEGPKINAFVIYMIDPFESPSAIWELCSAFWVLFQAYGPGPSGRSDLLAKPDLVLQIIPMKYVASLDMPVILDNSTYSSLAREVYDRCPPSAPSPDKTPLSIYSAPSFQLEEQIPRTIPFKLIAEPPHDLLRENSYIHVGYAISLDGNWVTAAWTDNCGKSRTVVSYNLGTRPFAEIAKEIWQTTVEICSARRVFWRLCVIKVGVMEREEFEAWVTLCSSPTQLCLFITLLTLDPTPPIQLTPTMMSTNPPNNGTTHPGANTPGSTPQAGVSPDPTANLTPAATPAAESATDPSADPEARLVDVTDESWGVILSHRLHNTNSTVEFRPCLISGLLVKRGLPAQQIQTPNIPDPEQGPLVAAVNILWVGAVNSTRAAVSPFPVPPTPSPGPSPMTPSASTSEGQSIPSPAAERPSSSLMWTPTPQTRATAENLLKEVLMHFRNLGTLARAKGIRGTRMGVLPWHVAVAKRGVESLTKIAPV
jgi:mediator of RNA polymerase II transcription subunit 13